MLSLDTLVYKLLHQYDCVIIPGFGGFITRESPAAVNPLNHTVKPYTKTVFFNPHLKDNDGLLAKAVADEQGCDYDTAISHIKTWVSTHEALLEDEKSFRFEHLGAFYLNNDGRKWFSPAYKLNVSKQSYGLEAVPAHEIERLTVVDSTEENKTAEQWLAEVENQAATEARADKKAIEPVEKQSSSLRSLLVAASVALLVHVAYVWVDNRPVTAETASVIPVANHDWQQGIPADIDSAATQRALESGITAAPDTTIYPPLSAIDQPTQVPETPLAETPAAVTSAPVVKEEKTFEAPAPAPAAAEEISTEYYTVFGSFLLKENADNLVKDLQKQGINASLITSESNGHTFIRVTGGSYATEQEAAESLSNITSVSRPIVVHIKKQSIINE